MFSNPTRRRFVHRRRMAMDNSSFCDSLFNSALNKLCKFIDKDTMQKVLDDYPPIIILKVIWKMLKINYGNDELLHDRTLYYIEKYEKTFNQGCVIAHLLINVFTEPLWNFENSILRKNETRHEIYFRDKFNFCGQFNPDIFFKLLEVAKSQCKVFVIFQICVQKNGIMFPKHFAEMWIEKIKPQENEININHIERGVKLGIFLGDCGWYSESSLVLSYTYKMISTKWVCSDSNVKLIQSVQCLAKWLLVVTYYNDFDEAIAVLSRMLCNIGLLESVGSQVDKRSQSCLVNAYLAVSEHYYEIKDYEKAWFWAVKIIDKLNDEISDTLRLSVICHFIKVCPATNKANIGKQLLEESLYSYTNKIDPKTCIDIIINVAGYQIHADLIRFTVSSYLTSIGWSRYLFGYCNLYTAKLMVDYAHARYDSNFTELTDIKHAMSSVVQGIYIMEKIGIPDNNMLLVNARMIKSSIFQRIFATNLPSLLNPMETVTMTVNNFMNSMADAETCYKKSLEISLKSFGKNAPFVARCNYNMGKLYQNQIRYMTSMSTQIDILEIEAFLTNKESDAQHYKKQLSEMRSIRLDKLEKAKPYFLEAKAIYEAVNGAEYFWLVHVYRRLAEEYKLQEDDVRFEEYRNKVLSLESNIKKVDITHMVNIDEVKDYVCLEKFKRIINDSE